MKWLCLLALAGCVGDDEAPLDEGGEVLLAAAAFNTCPRLVASAITPLTVAVGDSAELLVEAADRDGDEVAYGWSASDGWFSEPHSTVTRYTCASAGSKQLTLTLRDGPGCTRTVALTLACTP